MVTQSIEAVVQLGEHAIGNDPIGQKLIVGLGIDLFDYRIFILYIL